MTQKYILLHDVRSDLKAGTTVYQWILQVRRGSPFAPLFRSSDDALIQQ